MFVYLAGIDVEVELPRAVAAAVTDDCVGFVDATGAVVAIFPAASVVMYSKTRSYQGELLSSDGHMNGATQNAPPTI